jgi:hypothetical protein
MWLFTKLGFFSVVEDRNDRRRVQVRARVREDIEAVAKLVASKASVDAEILETPDADYRFRILITKAAWAKVGKTLTADIDYPNFKGRVLSGMRDRNRSDAYHTVWEAMRELQESAATSKRR